MAVACGCASDPSAGAHEGHNHADNIELTAYSDNYEVFAVVTPLAVGVESEIHAHLTHLDDFKPLTEGEVSVSLVVGEDGIMQTASAPEEPGIYHLTITPETAGEAVVVFEVGGEMLIATDVMVYDELHEAQHAAVDAIVTSSNGAHFTKEQSWRVDFATEEAHLEPIGVMINSVGKVVNIPTQMQIVVAKGRGSLMCVNSSLAEGTYVRKGTLLASIVSSSFVNDNMNVKLSEANANFTLAKQEYKRKKELAKEQIVTRSELERAKANYTTAKSVLDNLKANFSQQGERVVAPMDGYVSHIYIDNGEFVDQGDVLYSISKSNKVRITAQVSAKYYAELDDISEVIFSQQNRGVSYTLDELDGSILGYSHDLEGGETLISVTFAVDNSKAQLLVGSLINIDIVTLGDDAVITVPRGALIEEMGNFFVYKQLTAELFEKSPVHIGRLNARRVEITEGLEVEERVVSEGAVMVKLSQSAGAIDPHAGHVH